MENNKHKKTLSKVFSLVFVGILMVPTLGWGVLSFANVFNPKIMEGLNVDTGENRNMASFPDKFNPNTITSDIEKWYNDNLPFRSVLYKTENKIENTIELPYVNKIKPFLTNVFYPITSDDLNNKYQEGYEEGVLAGKENGKQEGYEEGKNDGYNQGYENGYKDGLESEEGDGCNHLYSDGVIAQNPTCLENGIYERECTKCGSKSELTIKKLDHNLILKNKVEKTCIVDGIETYNCSMCHNDYEFLIEEHGHKGKMLKISQPSYEDYGYTLYECEVCHGHYRTDIKAKPIDTSYMAPYYYGASKATLAGRGDWLFFNGEGNLRYYLGSIDFGEENIAKYKDNLDRFTKWCKDNNKKFIFTCFPNKEPIYDEYLPTLTRTSDHFAVDSFVKEYNATRDHKIQYVKQELLANKSNWQLYLKHDTHWNKAGAYIAFQEIYKHFNLPTVPLYDLPVTEYKESGGDLITMGGLDSTKYQDTNYKIGYEGISKIYNLPEIEEKIFFVGDSYRTAMGDFIAADFKNYTTTHHNTMKADPNYVFEEIKSADYIIVSSVERAFAGVMGNLDYFLKEVGI